MNYYFLINGEQAGPYTVPQARALWSDARITSQTLYWQEGMSEWIEVENLFELPPEPVTPRASVQVQPQIADQDAQFPAIFIWIVGLVGALVLGSIAYEILTATVFHDHYYNLPHISDLGVSLPPIWILGPGLLIYFLPSILAGGKKHLGLVFILNLLFGWTVIVWIACILVALFSPAEEQAA